MGTGSDRRLLMLVHDFPPAMSGGTLRPFKFAIYLERFGWSPVVLTVRASTYHHRDSALLDQLPPSVEVHRTPTLLSPRRARAARERLTDAPEGGRLGNGPLDWARDRWLVPDTRVLWWPFALPRAAALHAGKRFDAIYATGPPFSTLALGRRVKHLTGRPLLTDFRDPWTHAFDEHRSGERPERLRRESALENDVIRASDAIVVTTSTLEAQMRATYGDEASGKVHVITNGYDDADYHGLSPQAFTRFAIVYSGKLNREYAPEPLFDALEALLVERPTLPDRLELHLVGECDAACQRRIRGSGLARLVTLHGQVDHATSLRHQLGADLLLALSPGGSNQISGKVFEYLYSGAPILGILPPASEAARLIQGTEGGSVVAPSDVGAVALSLRRHLAAWEAGSHRLARPRPDPTIAAYSRVALTGKLAAVLDGVVSRGGPV